MPSYDDYKLASPPEYEREHCDCGEPDCEACASAQAQTDAYDRHIDQQIDEAREREWDRP